MRAVWFVTGIPIGVLFVVGASAAQDSLPVAQLPGISWGSIAFIASNIFYAGMMIMRQIQLERTVRENRESCDRLTREMRDAHAQEMNSLRSLVQKHHDNERIHSIDAPGERQLLLQHDRAIARMGGKD